MLQCVMLNRVYELFKKFVYLLMFTVATALFPLISSARLPDSCIDFDINECLDSCTNGLIGPSRCSLVCGIIADECEGVFEPKLGLVVWRPESGVWFRAIPNSYDERFFTPESSFVVGSQQLGLPGDLPIGTPLIARTDRPMGVAFSVRSALQVYRQTTGQWYKCGYGDSLSVNAQTFSAEEIVSQQCSLEEEVQFGLQGDVPMMEDFDDDGVLDRVVWRPATGMWYVLMSRDSSAVQIQLGLPGDYPLLGDFNNDGLSDFAVYRPSLGMWYVRTTTDLPFGSQEPVELIVRQWGLPQDSPFVADFDGDDQSDFAVWRPESGMWFMCLSGQEYDCPNRAVIAQFGLPGDYPLTADFDIDGKDDLAVWRPSTGTWFFRSSLKGSVHSREWGVDTDVPVGLGVKDLVDRFVDGG